MKAIVGGVMRLLVGGVLFGVVSGADAAPFPFLQAGFTQEVFATKSGFFGGVAFAPDGDVYVDNCAFSGSPLTRFDLQTTVIVSGTSVHPEVAGSPFPSNAGCGLTNHPDGTLYSNTSLGVVNLDANTGVQLRPPFGPAGNALGITPDPQTGNLVYVGSDGTIHFVDQGFTISGVFSMATTGHFVDGIAFDPTGNFLFMSDRIPSFSLTIVDRTGALVQAVPMTSEPDGIAFHASPPPFVVTNNIDGTMTRFDFPGNDYTMPPAQSVFASGGFRGDLSQVGSDNCLYLTQEGTRFDDGTESGDNSVVRICGGFAPPVNACLGATATIFVQNGIIVGGPDAGKLYVGVLRGTQGDDVILGTPGQDLIKGYGGHDIICGGGDRDIIEGGDGDDMIDGGAGNDLLKGQRGNDTIFGGEGDDVIEGGEGDDYLDGGTGFDTLKGQAGTDTCVAGEANFFCEVVLP